MIVRIRFCSLQEYGDRESMSPTIPILSALLLSLISGSTEGGQRMDSLALLRQTLRYWRKIYRMYQEEVMLGYCWADYLLEISDELSANVSAMADRFGGSIGPANGQPKPSPQNLMIRAARPQRATRTEKRLREKRPRAATSPATRHLVDEPDEHRAAATGSRLLLGGQQGWTVSSVERGVAVATNDSTRGSVLIDPCDDRG
jgi:hypothetical protein